MELPLSFSLGFAPTVRAFLRAFLMLDEYMPIAAVMRTKGGRCFRRHT